MHDSMVSNCYYITGLICFTYIHMKYFDLTL